MNVRGWSLRLICRPSHGLNMLSVALETVDAKANTKNTAPKTSPTRTIADSLCMRTCVLPNIQRNANQQVSIKHYRRACDRNVCSIRCARDPIVIGSQWSEYQGFRLAQTAESPPHATPTTSPPACAKFATGPIQPVKQSPNHAIIRMTLR